MRAVRDADSAGALHEPVELLLPPLPAAALAPQLT